MYRSCLALTAALLLFFSAVSFVPSLIGVCQTEPQVREHWPPGTVPEDTTEREVGLDIVRFTPSASCEKGIYYVARSGADAVAYFGKSEVYYLVGRTSIRLDFPGSTGVVPTGEEPTGSFTSYFLGNDPSRWRTHLGDCAVLRYGNIYSGIDLVYKILDGNLKYEFVVSSQSDPGLIRMRYADADWIDVNNYSVTIAKEGLVLQDAGLAAFQDDASVTRVPCTFRHSDRSTVALSVGTYDPSYELLVDPVLLSYSTYLGGPNEEDGYAVAVENGFVYVGGRTLSSSFPVTGDTYDNSYNGNGDCFVTKLSLDGRSLVYSTFLGGSGIDDGCGDIVVDNGIVYVTGHTYSSDFPAVGAYDSSINGDGDCFVTKLAADGQSVIYSTFIGGSSNDNGQSIALDSGSVCITGYTASPNFPTVNAYDPTYNGIYDGFVTKFAVDGKSLVYSTYLGGASDDYTSKICAEDSFVYVTGYTSSSGFPAVNAFDSSHNGGVDCFLTKFAADGQSLVYSTFLGGADNDAGMGIAVQDGCAFVTGSTLSPNFPTAHAFDATHGGGYDCFVTRFTVSAQAIAYSTFLGGSGNDGGRRIAVEGDSAYITGETSSSDFPTISAYDWTYNGQYDCFVTRLTVGGDYIIFSTYLGGPEHDYGYAIDVESGRVFVAGSTYSSGFPTSFAYDSTHNGASDCFVTSIYEDSDSDGLTDWEEAEYGTNPLCIDSDSDNFLDGYEVAYGSDPMDPLSYPHMPQSWYDAIYEDLEGNTALIQQVISWLDENHTAIETLFCYLGGNATLLIQTVNAVNGNSTQLELLAAVVTQDIEALNSLNATHVGDIDQIRAVLDELGVTVGDTDYDGLDDLDEIAYGTNIRCIDTDCDNLNDAYEVKIGTDPNDHDSDNDTYFDGAEVLAGTNPLDSLDYPGRTSTTTTTGPPMGIEPIIVAGAAGCVGVVVLWAAMKRKASAKPSS